MTTHAARTDSMTEQAGAGRLFGAVLRPIQDFLRTEAAGGILLLAAAVIAMIWANAHPPSYQGVFGYPLMLGAGAASAHFTVQQLIDDGLMTLFFAVVGMEIKRELVVGELNSIGKASLPAVAALGGALVPVGLFTLWNAGGPGQHGWAIPMATDIAFCIGVLTLLKDRVPHALIVFVTALAIFDDIGGILVIALFYGHGLHPAWLLLSGALTLLLFIAQRAHVVNGLAYALIGAGLWYALHHAGIHATIAGVVVGLMIPVKPSRASDEVLRELAAHAAALQLRPSDDAGRRAELLAIEERIEHLEAPVERFIHLLHPLVAFGIMPAFALANAGVSLQGAGLSSLASPIALGASTGLFFGKQAGIFAFTSVAIRLGLAPMPGGASAVKLFGVSMVAGIGFTVALFLAALAFPGDPLHLDQAKLGILAGSLISGLGGFAILRFTRREG
jgi:Na+:H+ antiporter, NhaA family